MTLNFTSYSVFPASIRVDDDFASARRDRAAEGFNTSYWSHWETDDPYEFGGDGEWVDPYGSYDPIDLLPADPFGMGLSTTLSAAIASWIEDFEGHEVGGDDFVAGLSYYWNKALLSSTEAHSSSGSSFNDWVDVGSLEFSAYEAQDGVSGSVGGGEGVSNSSGAEVVSDGEESVPHMGFLLSLQYLDVQDLLSVERVCKSVRSIVQNDPLLWKCIHIDSSLSDKITDDALLGLTKRGQGKMQCLSLVGCSKITDDGLKCVLESCPMLQKLNVSGCVRLSVEGLVNNLKAAKSSGMPGIKQLKLGRLFSVSPEHFEELKLLLGMGEQQQPKVCKPRFYHSGNFSLSCAEDRAIDVEMCPGCQKFKLVYDCPSESCRGKGLDPCRACDVCIERCVQCGRCINGCRYVETFCLEYLCSDCWKHPPPTYGVLEEK